MDEQQRIEDEGMAHAMANAEAPLWEYKKEQMDVAQKIFKGNDLDAFAVELGVQIDKQAKELSEKAAQVYLKAEQAMPALMREALLYGRSKITYTDEAEKRAFADAFHRRIMEYDPKQNLFVWKDDRMTDAFDEDRKEYIITFDSSKKKP